MPVPIDTISRLVSTSGEPAFSQARRPSTVGHLLQVGQPTQFDLGQLAVEVLEQVSTDADRQVVLLDEGVFERADAALPVQQRLPGAIPRRSPTRSSSRNR